MPSSNLSRRVRWISCLGGAAVLAAALALTVRGRTAPRLEGPVRLVLAGAPTTFDPQRSVDELTRAVLDHFYEPLVDLGPDLELRPRLALSWKSPSDTEWWFQLREGVVFHDGRPFGAEDVKATLERARTLLDGFVTETDIHAIEEVRAVDARTVAIRTKGPRPLLLARLTGIAILPRDAPKEVIWRPVGTGPWVFAGSGTGQDGGPVRGRRFDRYWGKKPSFAELVIEAAPGEAERAKAALEGAHLTSPLPRAALDAHGEPLGPFRVVRHPTLTVAFLTCRAVPAFGGKPTPFQDVRVRRAVSLALDRERLVEAALDGEGRPLWQLAPPGVVGFDPALPRSGPDAAAARRLLAEAGYPEGISSTLVAATRNERVAREVARQLAAAGIALAVEIYPDDEVFRRTMFGLAALSVSSATLAAGDVTILYESILHTGTGEGTFGGENWSRYSSERMDEAIRRAARELQPSVRAELLAAITRLALEELPYVPLFSPDWTYGVRNGLSFSPRLDRAVLAADLTPLSR